MLCICCFIIWFQFRNQWLAQSAFFEQGDLCLKVCFVCHLSIGYCLSSIVFSCTCWQAHLDSEGKNANCNVNFSFFALSINCHLMSIHRIQLIKLSNQEVLDILIIREISPVLKSCQSIALLGINKKSHSF